MNNISRLLQIIICITIWLSSCTAVQEQRSLDTSSLPMEDATLTIVKLPTLTPTATLLSIGSPTPPQVTTGPTQSTLTPTPSSSLIISVTATPTPIPDYLQGPLIAFRIQNDNAYLLLLDIGTLTLREIRKDFLEYAFRLEWLDSGCHLYTRGRVIDLHGNVIQQLADVDDNNEPFRVSHLAPNRQWGVVEIFSGFHEGKLQELEFLNLEILSQTNLTTRIPLAPNGGAFAYAWSPDSEWLAFSDFDENQILQVYRATQDGEKVEQLTFHDQEPGVINLLAWSPDGQNLAYAASTLLAHQFEQRHEGWIGLISLSDLEIVRVTPGQFAYTIGMWWNQENNRLVFVGEGFPTTPEGESIRNKQIHWVDRHTSVIYNSFEQVQSPIGDFGLSIPVGDIDTIFFSARDGYYLLDASTNHYEKILGDIETHGLIRDFVSAPFDFPGELVCIESE